MMTTAQEFERRRWIALALLGVAQFVVVLDASIVNVALPTIGDGARLLPGQPLLGRQRLRAHLRRLPAARRAARRPARPPPRLHGRPDPLRARLARRRASPTTEGAADRRPRRPGPRRRDPLARRALDRHHHLPRRRRAQQGARRLGRGRRLRRRRRRPARRHPHRRPRLGVGPLGQRARSAIAAAALAPRLIAESRSESETRALRRRRRGHRHRRPVAARLRAGRRRPTPAGARPRRSACSRSRSRCSRRSSRSSCARRAPLVPFRIFRMRTLTGANVVGLLIGASLFSMFFFISLYMQQVLGYSAIKAGLSYLPLARVDHRRGRGRVAARHAGSASSRCSPPGCCLIAARAALVRPGLGRRQLPRRHPRAVAAGRGRPRLRVRAA